MPDDLQTINPDQVAVASAIAPDAFVFIQVAGGPLQKIPVGQLLAKLIATDLVKADEPTLAADLAHDADTVAFVFDDPVALNNGWWRKIGAPGAGSWDQFETLALSARDLAVSAAEQVAETVINYNEWPSFLSLVVDSAGNRLVWLDSGLLDSVGLGPRIMNNLSAVLGVAEFTGSVLPQWVPLALDAAGNVVLWLDRGAIDAAALGPLLRTDVRKLVGLDSSGEFLHSRGGGLKRFKAALYNATSATTKTRQAHYWLQGDSHTERACIPQAISTDLQAQGIALVGTGYVSINSTGTVITSTSRPLLDGASLTVTSGALYDIAAGTWVAGEASPDGFRREFAAGDTTAGWSVAAAKGRYCTSYYTLNGATLRFTVDGGAAATVTSAGATIVATALGGGLTAYDVTLPNTGLPGKVVLDAGAEGAHAFAMTRPVATGILYWFAAWCWSNLPGLIISKAGNEGGKFSHFDTAMATATAAYILLDIHPETVLSGGVKRITLNRWALLTNDSNQGDAPAAVAASARACFAKLRAADPKSEILLSVPPPNAQSGITTGLGIGEYLPSLVALAHEVGVEIANHHAGFPPWADCPGWLDNLHVDKDGGIPEIIARRERRYHLEF